LRDNVIRIVVVVSTDPSDLYFANQMARRFRLVGILLEHQREAPDSRPRWKKAAASLRQPREFFTRSAQLCGRQWHRWTSRRFLDEQPADFGDDGRRLDSSVDAPVLRVEGKGRLNDPENVAWIRERSPDLIVVCGASILKEPILEIPTLGSLNLHGGLSQFYRGLFTTDWAIHNGEPEKIGATVHFISTGIDDGKVVYQGRPALTEDDHPNKAYEKVVRLGVEMMTAAIRSLEADELHPPVAAPRGQLYRERDFTHRVKRRLWRRWRRVMLTYENDREHLDAAMEAHLLNPFNRPAHNDAHPADHRPRGEVL
jgi:methionyl-tRNA formyltransferase